MTIITEPGNYCHSIHAVVFAAHPEKGSTVADVVVAANCKPIGQRIRNLVASVLGDEWEVFDWHTADGEL